MGHRVKPILQQARPAGHPDTVVYFPSCINQSMGVAKGAPDNTPLTEKMVGLLRKAGYRVIYPDNMDSLCCGTIWESKGMPHVADEKTEELGKALWVASRAGKYPVLCGPESLLVQNARENHRYASVRTGRIYRDIFSAQTGFSSYRQSGSSPRYVYL